MQNRSLRSSRTSKSKHILDAANLSICWGLRLPIWQQRAPGLQQGPKGCLLGARAACVIGKLYLIKQFSTQKHCTQSSVSEHIILYNNII